MGGEGERSHTRPPGMGPGPGASPQQQPSSAQTRVGSKGERSHPRLSAAHFSCKPQVQRETGSSGTHSSVRLQVNICPVHGPTLLDESEHDLFPLHSSVEEPAQSSQICRALAEAPSSDMNSPNEYSKLPKPPGPHRGPALGWKPSRSGEPCKSIQSTSVFVQALEDQNTRWTSVGFDIEIRVKF